MFPIRFRSPPYGHKSRRHNRNGRTTAPLPDGVDADSQPTVQHVHRRGMYTCGHHVSRRRYARLRSSRITNTPIRSNSALTFDLDGIPPHNNKRR